jgi:hypothetical protein
MKASKLKCACGPTMEDGAWMWTETIVVMREVDYLGVGLDDELDIDVDGPSDAIGDGVDLVCTACNTCITTDFEPVNELEMQL